MFSSSHFLLQRSVCMMCSVKIVDKKKKNRSRKFKSRLNTFLCWLLKCRLSIILCCAFHTDLPHRWKLPGQRWTCSLSLLQEQIQEMQFRQPTLEMAALARFPEIMCVLSSHALLEESFGTNPGARIYISKCGKPTELHWAAFRSTCRSTGLSKSSMVLVAHNCTRKDVVFEGNKSHTQEKKI